MSEGSTKKTAAEAKTTQSPPYVVELRPNDCLLGRGAPIIKFVGNVRFRKLVQQMSTEYMGTQRREHKDSIAREIVGIVESRDGRFLRKVSKQEAKDMNIPEGVKAWVPAEEAAVLQKIKQAIRDNEYKPTTEAAGLGSPSSSGDRKLSASERTGLASSFPLANALMAQEGRAASLPMAFLQQQNYAAALAAAASSQQQQQPSLLDRLNSFAAAQQAHQNQQLGASLNEQNSALLRALAERQQTSNALQQSQQQQQQQQQQTLTSLLQQQQQQQQQQAGGGLGPSSIYNNSSSSGVSTAADLLRLQLAAQMGGGAVAGGVNNPSSFLPAAASQQPSAAAQAAQMGVGGGGGGMMFPGSSNSIEEELARRRAMALAELQMMSAGRTRQIENLERASQERQFRIDAALAQQQQQQQQQQQMTNPLASSLAALGGGGGGGGSQNPQQQQQPLSEAGRVDPAALLHLQSQAAAGDDPRSLLMNEQLNIQQSQGSDSRTPVGGAGAQPKEEKEEEEDNNEDAMSSDDNDNAPAAAAVAQDVSDDDDEDNDNVRKRSPVTDFSTSQPTKMKKADE